MKQLCKEKFCPYPPQNAATFEEVTRDSKAFCSGSRENNQRKIIKKYPKSQINTYLEICRNSKERRNSKSKLLISIAVLFYTVF